MSTALAHTDCSSFSTLPKVGYGPDVSYLRNKDFEIWKHFRQTETGYRKEEALESLYEVYKECSEEGWDGYEALPITEDAYFEAMKLIENLPLISWLPLPEITPEPDGGIGLEWYTGLRQVLVASVSGRNEIVYAGLFGASKVHGTEEYFDDSLPSIIIECLRKLYR